MTATRINDAALIALVLLIVALGAALFGSVGEIAFSVADSQQGSGE
jgi:hypothetical protein